MGFSVAFSNVLITLLYLIPGFLLKKAGKVSEAHLPTLSAVLVYLGTPALVISAFVSLDYSRENLINMLLFFAASLVLQAVFVGGVYLIFRKKMADAKYRVFACASILGNVGFFGLPVVRALMPDNPEVACYSAIYSVSMNILAFTIGVCLITNDRKHMSLKSAFINPVMLGLMIGLPAYILSAKDFAPTVLISAVNTLSAITTPLCMTILGIRLASAPLKNIFNSPSAYLATANKLLIFPLFCYFAVYLLPLPLSFKYSMLIISGTPCASVILSLSEMHRSNADIAANCLLISTLFCFISIPTLTLFA